MKQFLTLCMAAAMVGVGALSANANITYEQAMQMKKEGKAFKAPLKMRNHNSLKTLPKASPVSRFHKMMNEKADGMMKAPQKVTPAGDNIYGYLLFSSDIDSKPIGLYEFQNTQSSLVWQDPLVEMTGFSATSLGLQENTLKGYSIMTFWGMILGIDYVEYDFESGELLRLEEQDIQTNVDYLQTIAVDSENSVIYGYGFIGDGLAFGSAPVDDPFNYTKIKDASEDEGCLSLTYNPTDGKMYGVNGNYEFVCVDKDGSQEVLMNLNVPDGAQYITGIAYDPVSDLYYWNINRNDDSAAMATIDLKTKTLNIYDELEYGEEYGSLFTTDEVVNPLQPQRPTAGEVNFYKNSPTGYVTFTLPTEMGDGAAIEGSVSYRTYVDGQLYSTGTAAAGEVVNANFAVEPDMMHTFGMTAVINGVESAMAKVKGYVGNDTPLAPQNVVLNEDGISWDAVTEGVHGGYVDSSEMRYKVSLNGEILGTTDATSFAHIFNPEAELQAYTAEVVATCNGFTSESAYSNSITSGAALQLPQFIQPTEEQFELSTVLDNNQDGVTWLYNSTNECIQTNYSDPGVRMDDWYFLPKMEFNDPNKFYSFSFEVALRSSYYTEEYVEVLLCNEASPRGVVMPAIIDEFSPESMEFEYASGEFRVRQPGVYYIAIHCTSEGDQAGIAARNFTVEDNNITFESPVPVEDLSVEAAEGGKLEATVSFTMPTMTIGDATIDPAKELKATVGGGIADVIVSGKPGDAVTTKVETVQGINKITVFVSDGDFNSPIASTTVKCGYDVPSTVNTETFSSSVSEDMLSMTLKWDPVTTGWISDDDPTGGLIDPSKVVYDIYMYDSSYGQWMMIDGGITETEYTYSVPAGTPQDMVRLGVSARNIAGENGELAGATEVIGDPYALPFFEGWDDPEMLSTSPWVTYGNQCQYGIYDISAISDAYADKETRVLGITPTDSGSVGQLGIPKISTKDASNATVTFELMGDFTLPTTTVLAEAYGMEAEEIGEIKCEKAGLNKVSVTIPEKFLGKDWIGLYLYCEFETGDEALYLESISIANGTSVRTLDMSGVKIAGGKNQIKVSGLQNQNVIVSGLDGRVAAKSEKISGNATFDVQKGIYVVKAGNKNAKVVVK